MLATLSSVNSRRSIVLPWLLIGGYTVAALDMLVAITYWAGHGVPASRILQGPAAWILGPVAYSGGSLTALAGAILYGHLMWGVVWLYHAIARRRPFLRRHPFACGPLYGVAAYVVIFQLMVPLATGTYPDFGNPNWLLVCIATFMLLVGLPCALFARAADNHLAREPSQENSVSAKR